MNKCSNCQDIFEPKELDRTLRNVLEKLLLKCPNCNKYNKEKVAKSNIMKVSEYNNHILNCEYSDYQCLICKKLFQHCKKRCYEHAHFCGYSDSICCYCSKNIKLYLKKEHEIECGKEIIECDLCNNKLERKKMENHKKKECIMRPVKCDNCQTTFKYKDFLNHSKDECKDNQINYWKKKYEESQKKFENAKQVLEEDFNFKYDDENLESFRKRKPLERQLTETNLLSNLNLDNTINSERNKEIRNPFLNSSIIKEKDIKYIKELFINAIPSNFNLVYKMSKDGEFNFHIKCDNVGPTLCIFKIRKNNNTDSYNRFGGFTSQNWDCSNKIKNDDSSFVFTLIFLSS